MVVLDEKTLLLYPPPPYAAPSAPPPFPGHAPPRAPTASLNTLPAHVLLHVVHDTFLCDRGRPERQRATLYWLSTCLRTVSRGLYVACMHVLRSTYLPAYTALVRAPFTSDPFPLSPQSSQSSQPPAPSYTPHAPPLPPTNITSSLQRETATLDLFLALKVREDAFADASEFHLERDEAYRDLFDLAQPRARAEDLLRRYAVRAGIVAADPAEPVPSGAGAAGKARERRNRLRFDCLSVAFSPRQLGVVLVSGGRKRTVVQVPRAREEVLEVGVKRLVRELGAWLDAGGR